MPTENPTLATIADYFRFGIIAGILEAESARAWADCVITELDHPPCEIIDISLSKDNLTLIDALKSIQGVRDTTLAGKWLLGLLRESIQPTDECLSWVARKAMQIASSTEMDQEVYYRFDSLEDEIFLAKSNTYGTLAECRTNLINALSAYQRASFRCS